MNLQYVGLALHFTVFDSTSLITASLFWGYF